MRYQAASSTPSLNAAPTATSFAATQSPTIVMSDSPAYTPAGPQIPFEDDRPFIATYTYTEYQVTVNATGSLPITTGIAQPTSVPALSAPCMITPGAQAPFTLLNDQFIPMVSRTSNSIGPLLQPTKAPAANDPILDLSTFTLPPFYLQQASGAAAGTYDMVYAKSGQFVAMDNRGQINLISASTGPNFKNGYVTSIFSYDCFGLLSIVQGGNKYSWTTTGSTSSLTKAADGGIPMKMLPVNKPAMVQRALRDHKENKALAERLMKRSYSDGPAPKCPASPPFLVPKFKQGFVLDQGNFCEALDDKWKLSPFDFDKSCIVQSLCYDQCENFGWQSCNAVFGYLMLFSCQQSFSHWWEIVPALACAGQAGYFISVAATEEGRKLFYKAQGSMCRCFCTNPGDTCVYPDNSFYCANTRGNDLNNCGACGRTCGYGLAWYDCSNHT